MVQWMTLKSDDLVEKSISMHFIFQEFMVPFPPSLCLNHAFIILAVNIHWHLYLLLKSVVPLMFFLKLEQLSISFCSSSSILYSPSDIMKNSLIHLTFLRTLGKNSFEQGDKLFESSYLTSYYLRTYQGLQSLLLKVRSLLSVWCSFPLTERQRWNRSSVIWLSTKLIA